MKKRHKHESTYSPHIKMCSGCYIFVSGLSAVAFEKMSSGIKAGRRAVTNALVSSKDPGPIVTGASMGKQRMLLYNRNFLALIPV